MENYSKVIEDNTPKQIIGRSIENKEYAAEHLSSHFG